MATTSPTPPSSSQPTPSGPVRAPSSEPAPAGPPSPPSSEPTPGPLSEFMSFLGDFTNLVAIVSKSALLAPLADIVLRIGSPSPSTSISVTTSCFVALIVLMSSFVFWRQGQVSLEHIKRRQLQFMWGWIGATSIYFLFWCFFVVDNHNMWNRDVKGFVFHKNIAELVATDPSKYTTDYLLEIFGRKVGRIWQEWSINLMRFIIFILWQLVWIMFAANISSFLAIQYRRFKPKATLK